MFHEDAKVGHPYFWPFEAISALLALSPEAAPVKAAPHLSAGSIPGLITDTQEGPTAQVAPSPQQMGPGVQLHQRAHIGTGIGMETEPCSGGT